MQKVIEFKKRNFWSTHVDINALNEKISPLNAEGKFVKTIIPNAPLMGAITSYTLLLELNT